MFRSSTSKESKFQMCNTLRDFLKISVLVPLKYSRLTDGFLVSKCKVMHRAST